MAFNRKFQSTLIFIYDLLAVLVAWIGAYLLRFNFDVSAVLSHNPITWMLFVLLVTQYFACRMVKLYRGMWVFASILDLLRVFKAILISFFVLLALAAFVRNDDIIPRSIVVLYPVLLLFLMGGGTFYLAYL